MSQPEKTFAFLNGDVVVTIPAGFNKAVKAISLPYGNPNMNPSTGDFKPGRPLLNLAFEEEGKPGVPLIILERKVTVRLRYTQADQGAAAANKKPLALAYWDGSNWVRLTAAKHGFTLQPDDDPAKGGWSTITLSQWSDPPIAWGS